MLWVVMAIFHSLAVFGIVQVGLLNGEHVCEFCLCVLSQPCVRVVPVCSLSPLCASCACVFSLALVCELCLCVLSRPYVQVVPVCSLSPLCASCACVFSLALVCELCLCVLSRPFCLHTLEHAYALTSSLFLQTCPLPADTLEASGSMATSYTL